MTQADKIDVVSEIKDRLDVLDVVSEHVVLKKSGKNYWGCCPFHKEKTPSFSVNPEKGIYKCFGCGEGGDAISFLQKINNSSFVEVIKELADKFGLPIPAFGQSSEKQELKKQIHEVNQLAANYFNKLLVNEPEGIQARDYLTGRSLNQDIWQRFTIGYASKRPDGLINHILSTKKYKMEILDKAGLVSKKSSGNGYVDRFRNRIIVPIHDDKGNIVAFGARALDEGQNPKYLNSPETLVYNKSRTMYGLYQAKDTIKEQDSVILMEGYFDVISAHAHGLTNVVATSGTALTDQHVKMLARYTDSRRIYLAFDSDSAGIKATDRGAEVIKNAFVGLGDIKQFDQSYTNRPDNSICEIRVIVIPSGKDPDEFITNNGVDEYKKYVNQAPLLIDYQINRIINSDLIDAAPQEKAKLIKQLAPILSDIKNSVIQSEYIKQISGRLKIDEQALASELKKGATSGENANNESLRIVKKTSKKHFLAQKNLLSLHFIDSENITHQNLNNILKEVTFSEPSYKVINESIAKIIDEGRDFENLSDEIFTELAENEEAKQALSDIIFTLDDKKCLSDSKLLNQFIDENKAFLIRYSQVKENQRLKEEYHQANTDELSSLQIQYKLRDKIKYNSRMEILNEQ